MTSSLTIDNILIPLNEVWLKKNCTLFINYYENINLNCTIQGSGENIILNSVNIQDNLSLAIPAKDQYGSITLNNGESGSIFNTILTSNTKLNGWKFSGNGDGEFTLYINNSPIYFGTITQPYPEDKTILPNFKQLYANDNINIISTNITNNPSTNFYQITLFMS